MLKRLFPGFAAAALLAGAAGAQQLPSNTPPMPEAAKAAPEAVKAAPPAIKEAPKAIELSGELKSIDKEKRSLTLLPLTGVNKDVKVADGAIITRDGAKAALDQLKEGDDVRATFDATTNQATTLEVHSKLLKK
ncbi:MAG: hypothetical protein ACXWLM_09490 [Myxococcales bacterium]